jgi:hypothetical protein
MLPREELRLHAPPRVEVDVLDPPDVVNVIHQDAAPQRLPVNVADQVTLVPRGVNAVVGIQQFDREHRRVLAAHRDGVGIWLRLFVRVLVRIVDDHALERAVVVQREERRAVFLARAIRSPETSCRRQWASAQTGVADAVVGGNGFPHALERNGGRDVQVASEEVIAPWRGHHAATRLASSIECLLKRSRVIGPAIGFRAEVVDGKRVGTGCERTSRSAQRKQNRNPAKRRTCLHV